MGTLRYTSGALDVVAAAPVADAGVVAFLVKDVGGGVEMDALAPTCADACNAHVNERKNENIMRQAMVVDIFSAEKKRGYEGV